MLYREAGDYSTTYREDSQTFPIKFDRYRYYVVLIFAFAVVPLLINDYWLNAIFLPFLIYSIAALGLNILTGCFIVPFISITCMAFSISFVTKTV